MRSGFLFLSIVALAVLPTSATADLHTTLVQGAWAHCDTVDACYVEADCPTGFFVIGGGIEGDQSKLESSYPAFSGWIGTFRGAFREYASAAHANARAYAICSSDTDLQYISAQGPQSICSTGQACQAIVNCPDTTYTAIAGGNFSQGSELEASGPWGPSAWGIAWYKDREDSGSGALGSLIPYALCATGALANPTYSEPDTLTCGHDGPSCESLVSCEAGSILVSGGARAAQSKLESSYPISPDTWRITWYPATYEFGSGADGSAAPVAICLPGTSTAELIFADGFDR
jgi:hypothetical protein